MRKDTLDLCKETVDMCNDTLDLCKDSSHTSRVPEMCKETSATHGYVYRDS